MLKGKRVVVARWEPRYAREARAGIGRPCIQVGDLVKREALRLQDRERAADRPRLSGGCGDWVR